MCEHPHSPFPICNLLRRPTAGYVNERHSKVVGIMLNQSRQRKQFLWLYPPSGIFVDTLNNMAVDE
jgi:hypothetical protein